MVFLAYACITFRHLVTLLSNVRRQESLGQRRTTSTSLLRRKLVMFVRRLGCQRWMHAFCVCVVITFAGRRLGTNPRYSTMLANPACGQLNRVVSRVIYRVNVTLLRMHGRHL